ncbi:SDR family NAD(P)-dependent oxidoreductase [Thermomonospora umbrina]|uniref:NADP-dependent 3-hydroxy acid dehydrogenase YdfG n=1 Tax=Thermomonospora umbrina TaxID=111806 RepID=A0A3D9SWF5_9ACTN|nr:SDR family NAD(P)-dependent oxidoreductase [Thermomonospora umbrina]REE99927.1 NADP-dependent 3-hydroxy acid dehydrogenase YdfG [Thermomonospora umbrina]
MSAPPSDRRPTAVVTGAGSGIGAATARRLATEGYRVVLVGRRAERLGNVAARIAADGGAAETAAVDVTDRSAAGALAERLDRCDVLVNNAGGAIGTEPVSEADPADWRAMYETNVLGSLHMTQALLPALVASSGTVVVVSSTASFTVYEGGGGYSAAKHGEHVLAATLRLELCGEPVRVIEIAPGMVHTEEFSLNRYRGDTTKAAEVYAGVDAPLVAGDVADAIVWAITRPPHVNVDVLVLRPLAQAAQHKVHRREAPL